jgi:protease-4
MSEEARQANRELVDGLWDRYSDAVIDNRDLDPAGFERYSQQFDEVLQETNGDLARLAVEYGLVDELLTPDQARVRIADKVGYDHEGDFRGVAMADYVQATVDQSGAGADKRVGVITAEGAIVDGDARGGVIASDRIIALIRRAREDETVAALVLRLNSPGGSAFASELIRQELELTQLSGKPVVVSMGPVAASGGYWIASTADAIVAEPTTLTGSIGVFGIVPTFDEGMAAIGVRNDGVRTSPLSNISPLLPINEPTARILQASVEHTYERFINLVARGRDLSPEQVDAIAQGRVWIGTRALDLGLVDALGNREAAVNQAVELAKLDDFRIKHIEEPVSPRELLLRELMGAVGIEPPLAGNPLLQSLSEAGSLLNSLNDPRHVYALCEACRAEGANW